VSGDVSVTGAQGDVRANTVSGDVRLDGLRATSVKANTVSGDLEVRIDALTGRGDLSFNSVSGDVTLLVPRAFDADLSMSSVSGDVNSDFALTVSNTNRLRRGSVEARIGNGGRRLDVHTVSGSLRIRAIN
jgi:lia operon protein LiaG